MDFNSIFKHKIVAMLKSSSWSGERNVTAIVLGPNANDMFSLPLCIMSAAIINVVILEHLLTVLERLTYMSSFPLFVLFLSGPVSPFQSGFKRYIFI